MALSSRLGGRTRSWSEITALRLPRWHVIHGLRGRVVCVAALALAPTMILEVVTALQMSDVAATAYMDRLIDAARARDDDFEGVVSTTEGMLIRKPLPMVSRELGESMMERAGLPTQQLAARPASDVLSEPPLPAHAFAVIADRGGMILGQFPATASTGLTRLPSWMADAPNDVPVVPVTGLWLDQSEVICFHSRIASSGWTEAVCAPRVDYLASWRKALALHLTLVALAAAVALLLADIVGRRLVRPLQRMIDHAGAVASRSDQRAGDIPRSDVAEFETLRLGLERAEGVLRRRSAAERMALQEARTGHELLASVVNATPDLIHVKDLQGRYVLVNRAALQHHGVEDDEWKLLGRRANDVFSVDLARRLETIEREVLAHGEPRTCEVVSTRHDGVDRVYATTISPWRDATGRVAGVVDVARDVTEQRAGESRLRAVQGDLLRASRLSAMGAMASGLAHELNQPLAAATNYVNATGRLLERMELDGRTAPDEIRGAVKEAAAQLLRAGSIVRRLRDFIGRGEADLRGEDVCDLIVEACDVARADGVFAKVRLRVEVPAELTEAMVDRTQIQQVLLNLLRNAAEALDGRDNGEIVVRARTLPDGGLEIVVSDNGPGLAPEIVGRLFQPFASTKPVGMGIGLAICRTIVEGHGGSLDAAPNPDGGVAFRIGLVPLQRAEDEDA